MCDSQAHLENDHAANMKRLTQPAQFAKGVGPKKGELLKKLGINTIADLLFFFPRKYQDFSEASEIEELEENQLASIIGSVVDLDHQVSYSGRHILAILIGQQTQYLKAVWFNQSYMVNKFRIGQRVMLQGKVQKQGGRFQMTHPRVTWLEDNPENPEAGELLPVYGLTEGFNQRQMRDVIKAVVEDYASLLVEAIPDELREESDVCDIQTAIRQIHQPANQAEADAARKRLVYQELFVLQLALAIRRHRVRTLCTAPPMDMSTKIRSRILRRLPFELTQSQANALNEIAEDLKNDYPMNRLLHGEVGSGKTAVAVCTMLVAVANGYQAALMAPTEILARQHFRTLTEMLDGSRVEITLLTGSLKTAERRAANQLIASGKSNVVVGTHAILGGSTSFHKLGLVVIDEQHKFGVQQRAQLKQSEHDPHYLVMTATPIPRTVSMTLFGDLDVSILDKPPGIGSVVHTYLGEEANRDQWWEFVKKKLREGRQAYVVAPLVDADEDSELSSAERMFESLANGPLEAFRLDVLHGRQSAEEKDYSLQQFAKGKTQVLVATGVIEVGINVPNATVMTIQSAERFGLSQLHQLRGRVGRGKHPGFVCAFATSDDPESNDRLLAFKETNDGFQLAETDLKIRGPGDLFSTSQSGFPPLMIANLIDDARLLKQAQLDARRLIESAPGLEGEALARLRQLVMTRYGSALEISDVG